MKKVKVGIIGVGVISGIYLKNLTELFQNVEVFAICDLDEEKTKEKAEEYSIANVFSYDEMMKNKEIEIILNLTTPKSHYKICKDALENGKHVYVEKPLSLNYKEGKELVELAKEKKLLLGVAPDTFLGAGIQTCIHTINTGIIGDIVTASAYLQCHGHESWHKAPEFYYEVGGGPMFDMGPYYLTALISMVGSVDMVCGMTSKAFDERTITSKPKFGKKIPVEIPTNILGLLHFKNGAIGNIITSFDVWGTKTPRIEIHGTRGSLIVPDPNTFGGEILLKQSFDKEFKEIPFVSLYHENSRGIGISDMAECILRNETNNKANGELGLHVLEIMEKIHISSDKKEFITLESEARVPEAMSLNLIKGYVK